MGQKSGFHWKLVHLKYVDCGQAARMEKPLGGNATAGIWKKGGHAFLSLSCKVGPSLARGGGVMGETAIEEMFS